MGLSLNKLYLFKKEKQQEKNPTLDLVQRRDLFLFQLGHRRERLGWAGELGRRGRTGGGQGEGGSRGLTHLPFPPEQEVAQGMPLKELLLP